MDTEKCRVLLSAIETGSLSAAAEKSGYTTSGVSRMMAGLEQETGFPLLTRSRGGVIPTRECEDLLPAMRELVKWTEVYRQTAGSVVGLETGELRIGTAYGIYLHEISRQIADFGRDYPGIKIDITEATSTELTRALEDSKLDFCIISRREGNFDWIPFREDELLALIPADHPLAGSDSIPIAVYAKEQFISIYPGQETDNSRLFESCGIRPNTRYTTADSYTAFTMVEAGLGISMANSLIVKNWAGNVKEIPLDPPQTVEIGIAVPSLKELSPAGRKFLKYIERRPATAASL